jgi:A/G-specific adenine glycosylase
LPELGDRSLEDWCTDVLHARADETDEWDTLRHSFSHYDLDILPILVRISSMPGTVADEDGKTWHGRDDVLPGGIAAPVQKLVDQWKKVENDTHR